MYSLSRLLSNSVAMLENGVRKMVWLLWVYVTIGVRSPVGSKRRDQLALAVENEALTGAGRSLVQEAGAVPAWTGIRLRTGCGCESD